MTTLLGRQRGCGRARHSRNYTVCTVRFVPLDANYTVSQSVSVATPPSRSPRAFTIHHDRLKNKKDGSALLNFAGKLYKTRLRLLCATHGATSKYLRIRQFYWAARTWGA